MSHTTAQAVLRKTMALVDRHLAHVRLQPTPSTRLLDGPCAYCQKPLQGVRLDLITMTGDGMATCSAECAKKYDYHSNPHYVIDCINALINTDPMTDYDVIEIRDIVANFYKLRGAGIKK